ncbi:MAG: TerB family tellurite resistance protein [Crocinitomicaceae bacterium]|nr:TerB family tellurite resistance protein [Crocinitomicaceae bacterium]MBK8925783.1 TerB family tellurite resistance protein [Crocinitomicaceae bacterium]
MDAKQHLYYALGALAYAVAKADGSVQNEEREKVKQIVEEGTKHKMDFHYTDIIFQILQKDKMGFADVYQWAMKSFETGKYHLTPSLRSEFCQVIKEVANAFPPESPMEKKLIDQFAQDIENLSAKTAHE